MSGSAYSAGPYGAGRYSQRLTQNVGARVAAPSRVSMGAEMPVFPAGAAILAPTRLRVMPKGIIRQAGAAIRAPSRVSISGEMLWAPIARAPCEPWAALSVDCGCATAVPNSLSSMFPIVASGYGLHRYGVGPYSRGTTAVSS